MKNTFFKLLSIFPGPFFPALIFAVRESRFAIKNFRIFIACLLLGTAIIAGVGSITANISDSIHRNGRVLLGGDVEISQIQQRLTPAQKKYLSAAGKLSEIATLRTMARSRDDSSLVDLKAVDRNYPLYGTVSLKDRDYRADILARRNKHWGILLSEALAARLKLAVGDSLILGTVKYQVRGVIIRQPDINNSGFQLAPGAIISLDSLFKNSLIQPGSLVYYHNKIKLYQGIKGIDLENNIKKDFPDNGWRIRDSSSGGAGLRHFISRMGQFMALAGLTALLVGGIGVGTAVRSYLEEKTDSIATYKILGASRKVILITYLAQIMAIAVGAILLGLIAGALGPIILAEFFQGSLPIALNRTIYLKPLLLAAYYSISVALIFTLWPLAGALQVLPARLFRQKISREQNITKSPGYIMVILTLSLLLGAVIIYMSDFRRLTAATLMAAAVVFVILRGTSALLRVIIRRSPSPKNPLFRLALGNIYRPGNTTTSIIMALGFGLTMFAAIAALEHNLHRKINQQITGRAPSFFFIDLQKNQRKSFTDFLEKTPGVTRYHMVPNLRAGLPG
ncbi:MAG: ABC transporter permease, partial [Alphaproteobacteria bacterium]|nr:ABC transporter permease [Alphaproteobacteria bacterium]